MEGKYDRGLSEQTKCTHNKNDRTDVVLKCVANTLLFGLIFLPQLAHAQDVTPALGGITAFLRSLVNLFIFQWGYYIGILTLGIQGYRWKTGRISLMDLGSWGLGVFIVFFAPNIVSQIRSSAGGAVT